MDWTRSKLENQLVIHDKLRRYYSQRQGLLATAALWKLAVYDLHIKLKLRRVCSADIKGFQG